MNQKKLCGRKTYVKIDLDQIGENVRNIKENYPEYEYYIGVVKGNVYGHGSFTVNTMIENGINYLAVSSLKEAIHIRDYQKEIPILCLEPIDLDFMEEVLKYQITITVSSLEYVKNLVQKVKNPTLKIHLKINSGMNRLGFQDSDEVETAYQLLKENYVVEGIYTHFATLGISDPYWDKQLNKFKKITQKIDLNSIPMIHMGRSLTLINHPKIPFCNGIRLGILMYGFNMSPKEDISWKGKLRKLKANYRIRKYQISETTLSCKAHVEPAFSLYSSVIDIQTIEIGESTGYGITYQAKEKKRIAVADIGYADGLCRKNTNRMVWIHDRKYPIVGSVNMGMIQIEVDETVQIGDCVEIIGKHIPVTYVSSHIKTTPYECMCMIHENVPRIYEKNEELVNIEEWSMKNGL